MSKMFELKVANVSKPLFEGQALELYCRGTTGDMTVLAHHEPFVSTLKEGVVRITAADKEVHEFKIDSGVLEVAGNRAVVLCSSDVEEVSEN